MDKYPFKLPALPPNIETFILDDQFEEFRTANHGKTVTSDNSPFLAVLTHNLQRFEDYLANIAQRKACTVEVHFDDRPPIGLIDASNDKGAVENNKAGTWHDDVLWVNNFGYNSSRSGLMLACNVAHEGDHADQTKGGEYSVDQRIMFTISKILYDRGATNPFYRNNYAEVYARIAEAKFFLAAWEKVREIAPEKLTQDNYYLMLTSMKTHLEAHTNEAEMEKLNSRNQKKVAIPQNRFPGLLRAFPQVHPRFVKIATIQFLREKAPALNQQALNEMKLVADALHKEIRNIEAKRAAEQAAKHQAAEQARVNKIQEMIAKHHIPVLSTLPNPLPDITLHLDTLERAEQNLAPSPDKHNLCVAITPGFGLCAWYDLQPRERPYNPTPNRPTKVNVMETGMDDPDLSATRDENNIDEYEEVK